MRTDVGLIIPFTELIPHLPNTRPFTIYTSTPTVNTIYIYFYLYAVREGVLRVELVTVGQTASCSTLNTPSRTA
jgi:hypothetical protein